MRGRTGSGWRFREEKAKTTASCSEIRPTPRSSRPRLRRRQFRRFAEDAAPVGAAKFAQALDLGAVGPQSRADFGRSTWLAVTVYWLLRGKVNLLVRVGLVIHDEVIEVTSLKRVLKKLGLPGHVHTFRHAFISNALTQGIPEAILRQWVGHVDAEVIKLNTHIADVSSQAASTEAGRQAGTNMSPIQHKSSPTKRSRKMARAQSKRDSRVTRIPSLDNGEGGIRLMPHRNLLPFDGFRQQSQ